MQSLEYNSDRPKMIIPEYGRHIQKMAELATAEKDEKKKKEMANAVVEVMGNVSPRLKDVEDFQHKLWDQLFIMSDYKLEVDSPFEKPQPEDYSKRPVPLAYPQNFPKYRFYGNNIKKMIDEVKGWEDSDKKEGLILTIANHMKKCFLNWNRDVVDDQVIFQHLYELSGGEINLMKKDEDLSKASNLVHKSKKSSGKSRHKRRYRNYKRH